MIDVPSIITGMEAVKTHILKYARFNFYLLQATPFLSIFPQNLSQIL